MVAAVVVEVEEDAVVQFVDFSFHLVLNLLDGVGAGHLEYVGSDDFDDVVCLFFGKTLVFTKFITVGSLNGPANLVGLVGNLPARTLDDVSGCVLISVVDFMIHSVHVSFCMWFDSWSI